MDAFVASCFSRSFCSEKGKRDAELAGTAHSATCARTHTRAHTLRSSSFPEHRSTRSDRLRISWERAGITSRLAVRNSAGSFAQLRATSIDVTLMVNAPKLCECRTLTPAQILLL